MSCAVPSGMVTSVRASLAAKAMIAAWAAHASNTATPTTGLTLALAWAIGEGSFTSYYQGTNNFGSYHATAGFQRAHQQDAGYGMVAFLDHAPAPYITRMRVYPSLLAGASAFVTLVDKQVGGLSTVQTAQDYAQRTYVAGYYQGFHTPVTPLAQRAAAASAGTLTAGDQANISDGVSILNCHVPEAQAAMTGAPTDPGDPTATTVGPFAPLASRLTPGDKLVDFRLVTVSGIPHTLDNAATILGPAATSPPAGAVSIADCLAAPNGDGVWMFTNMTSASSGTATGFGSSSPTANVAIWSAVLVGAAGAIAASATTHVLDRARRFRSPRRRRVAA